MPDALKLCEGGVTGDHEVVEGECVQLSFRSRYLVGEDIMSRATWFTNCEDTWFTTFMTNKFAAEA